MPCSRAGCTRRAERFSTFFVTHAMTFKGYNLNGNSVDKWLVENSWGKKTGNNGNFIMTNKWFDNYVYEDCYFEDTLLEVSLTFTNIPRIAVQISRGAMTTKTSMQFTPNISFFSGP